MDTGPKAESRLRPRADRAARRRRPPLPRRGRQRARRRGAGALAAPRAPRPTSARGRAAVATRRRADGPHARHRRHQGPALRQPRAPALGRGRRPLSVLRQLHAGLPDLLLHARSRTRPTWPASEAERVRAWDSCFSLDHSYIHGGSVRASTRSALPPVDDAQARRPGSTSSARSGCVGCGRCITWCPVAIDITEEAAAMRHAHD